MTPFLWIMVGGFVLGIILMIAFGTGKKQNPVGFLVALIVAGVCAGSFVLDISINPHKNGYTPPTQPTEVVETASYDEIYQAYKANELVADDLYKHNRYQITAKVVGIESGGLFNMTGGATLTMQIMVDNTIVFFYAEFEEEQEEDLKKIVVGDTITFEGTCLSAGSWIDCEIVW